MNYAGKHRHKTMKNDNPYNTPYKKIFTHTNRFPHSSLERCVSCHYPFIPNPCDNLASAAELGLFDFYIPYKAFEYRANAL